MKKILTKIILFALLVLGFQGLNAQDQVFIVNSPYNIQYEMGQATTDNGWGGTLTFGEEVTGDLQTVVSDTLAGEFDADLPEEGCVTITNTDEVAGKIALIRRGSCSFSHKVNAAQEAGAIAAIVCNHTPGAGIIGMLTTDTAPGFGMDTIPTGFLSYEDCEELLMAMENGPVNVTVTVPVFFDVTASFAHQTPIGNAVPLDSMSVVLYHTDEEAVPADITWTITDPASTVTTLMTSGDVDNTGARFIVDEGYMPTMAGEYTVEASNSLTSDVISTSFIMTEGTYGIDDGTISGGVSTSNEGFVEDGYIYDAGMLLNTGAIDGFLIQNIEFGLDNWTEIQTNAVEVPTFSIVIYEADGDGDGIIPNQTSYDDLGAPVGFTIYTANGTEVDGETVQVPMPNSGLLLEPATYYYVMVRYDGTAAANDVVCQYLYGGTTGYFPFNNSPIITDAWYTGWAGGQNVIVRSHGITTTTIATNNLLPENTIAVYPNPTNSELNVGIKLENATEEMTVQLIDIVGHVYVNETIDNVKETSLTYDVSKYPAGNYYLQVITNEGVSFKSFVKH